MVQRPPLSNHGLRWESARVLHRGATDKETRGICTSCNEGHSLQQQ